ncbi:MAG: NAD(P)H-binding protein [Alteraurantiacibacter sp. bin_em_oilr2.035]|nr:NAD(P)H-binding protein [Aurantiacibacter atlanticus]MDF1834722.1 NAD(P)H-binding protein [Alteraurantiacibacter sp. bin_em_oilr2.035]
MSDAINARRQVMLVGATGLIGRHIIARTPDLPELNLQGLSRREINFTPGTRMELVLSDTSGWADAITSLQPETVLCALGTTHSKAGSDEAFRAVDYELVMEVARAAKQGGTRHFVLVSSVGANLMSRSFYLRTKGEVERDVRSLKFTRLDILRPGLLRGFREGETRPVEGLGRLLAPATDIFLRGDRAKYRSIRAGVLATAALQAAYEKAGGQFVHEHDSIMRLANRFEREHLPADDE